MDLINIGFIGLAAMFLLLFARVPVAIAMAIPAVVGIYYISGTDVLYSTTESVIWTHALSYTLVTIPMFVFMGEVLFAAGVTAELYATFRRWFGALRGGLALATVGASAGFAAASGSTLATTATMGVVSSKEMVDTGYSKSLASGSIVAGGGLGILIPPSTLLIIYGTLAEVSIGRLLVAGILPGILLAIVFMLTIGLIVTFKPSLAPSSPSVAWRDKFRGLGGLVWVLVLFVLIMGGMFLGFFSPTEASGVGALGSCVIAGVKKASLSDFVEAARRSVRTTGFIFAIIMAAFLLNYFLAITRVPIVLAEVVASLAAPNWVVFAGIVAVYLILGAFMDSLAMVVITIPIMMPLLSRMELDPVWFGIVLVLLVEVALITPPVGMNCYVLHGVAPDLGLPNIFKGALMFVTPMLLFVTLIYIFPEIALFLPSRM